MREERQPEKERAWMVRRSEMPHEEKSDRMGHVPMN